MAALTKLSDGSGVDTIAPKVDEPSATLTFRRTYKQFEEVAVLPNPGIAPSGYRDLEFIVSAAKAEGTWGVIHDDQEGTLRTTYVRYLDAIAPSESINLDDKSTIRRLCRLPSPNQSLVDEAIVGLIDHPNKQVVEAVVVNLTEAAVKLSDNLRGALVTLAETTKDSALLRLIGQKIPSVGPLVSKLVQNVEFSPFREGFGSVKVGLAELVEGLGCDPKRARVALQSDLGLSSNPGTPLGVVDKKGDGLEYLAVYSDGTVKSLIVDPCDRHNPYDVLRQPNQTVDTVVGLNGKAVHLSGLSSVVSEYTISYSTPRPDGSFRPRDVVCATDWSEIFGHHGSGDVWGRRVLYGDGTIRAKNGTGGRGYIPSDSLINHERVGWRGLSWSRPRKDLVPSKTAKTE